MNTAEDFLLLPLHTHVVAAAKTIMHFYPQTSVTDLAKLVAVNYHKLTAPTTVRPL